MHRRLVLPIALLALTASLGCSARTGPPTIGLGEPCGVCGMAIESRRFACARDTGGKTRIYDSIECLVRDRAVPVDAAVWLPDYDAGTLHPADSLWIVKGSFATPMGGGLAAFRTHVAADSVAHETGGRVLRFRDLIGREASS